MSITRENPAAFPRNHVYTDFEGMTLRDYFAAKVVANTILLYGFSTEKTSEWHASKAYFVADAMLQERNKTK